MKRPARIYTLEILLFVVLLASAFFILAPVSKKLDTGINAGKTVLAEVPLLIRKYISNELHKHILKSILLNRSKMSKQ